MESLRIDLIPHKLRHQHGQLLFAFSNLLFLFADRKKVNFAGLVVLLFDGHFEAHETNKIEDEDGFINFVGDVFGDGAVEKD